MFSYRTHFGPHKRIVYPWCCLSEDEDKVAKEAVRANPEARALMAEALSWDGDDGERPEHFPSEDHRGFCLCDFCEKEIRKRLPVKTTLTSVIDGRETTHHVFDHSERSTIMHSEIFDSSDIVL